jgi:hypothetical protein
MSDFNDEDLVRGLKKYFNHNGFKSDIQKNAIKSILSGNFNSCEIAREKLTRYSHFREERLLC